MKVFHKNVAGATNDCSGVTFFIEHHLPHLVLELTSADSVASMEGCEPDAHGMSPEKYRDLPEGVYHQLIRHEMGRAREECATDNFRSISTVMDNVKLVSSQQTIVALGQTPTLPPLICIGLRHHGSLGVRLTFHLTEKL